MSLSLIRRIFFAAAISIALHAVLFLLPGSGHVAQEGSVQGVLQVDLVLREQASLPVNDVIPLAQQEATRVDASLKVDSTSGLVTTSPVKERYFLYDEVDKVAEFTYAEPIANLDQINSLDEEGRVKVRVLINESGTVDSALVLEAEPSNIFNGVALRSLLLSRFSPAEKDGRLVKSQKILEMKFGTQKNN